MASKLWWTEAKQKASELGMSQEIISDEDLKSLQKRKVPKINGEPVW